MKFTDRVTERADRKVRRSAYCPPFLSPLDTLRSHPGELDRGRGRAIIVVRVVIRSTASAIEKLAKGKRCGVSVDRSGIPLHFAQTEDHGPLDKRLVRHGGERQRYQGRRQGSVLRCERLKPSVVGPTPGMIPGLMNEGSSISVAQDGQQ